MNEAPLASSSKADVHYGITAVGRLPLGKHTEGNRLTYKQAALAKCYTCMAGYTDGKFDCECPDCPLHPFMPYRDREPSEGAGGSENEGLEEVITESE